MTLPAAIQAIWDEMESVRAQVLAEADGLSQAQTDWRPAPGEWSVGEILSHLSIAETNTGKLTTKLTREAAASGVVDPYPMEVARFAPLPTGNRHGTQAPELVRPQANLPVVQLLNDLKAVRARSRQSLEKIAGLDPRTLTFKHFALGDLHLAQWWMLQGAHDRIHLDQLRAVTAAPGFPRA